MYFWKDSADIAENRSFRVGQTRENVDTRPSTNIRHISLSSTGIQNKNFGKTLEEAHRIGLQHALEEDPNYETNQLIQHVVGFAAIVGLFILGYWLYLPSQRESGGSKKKILNVNN